MTPASPPTRFFRVLGVCGRQVRLDLGACTLDVRIETVGPGRYRMVKPEEVRMIPGVFVAVVAAAIEAYKRGLEQGIPARGGEAEAGGEG